MCIVIIVESMGGQRATRMYSIYVFRLSCFLPCYLGVAATTRQVGSCLVPPFFR